MTTYRLICIALVLAALVAGALSALPEVRELETRLVVARG